MEKNQESQKKSGWGSTRFFVIIGLVIAMAVVCYFIFPAFQERVDNVFNILTSENQEKIEEWVKSFGVLGPIVLVLAMALQMFLLIIPNILLFTIAIISYGPVWGSLLCLIGVFCSSSIGYFIGKKLGPRAIDRFVSQKIQNRIEVFIERYGVKAVIIFRLSTISADSLGFVAGILEMEYKKFILATLVGVSPMIILLAIFGNSGRVETALIWIAGISLTALVVYFLLDKKRRRKAYEVEDVENPVGSR